MKKETLEKIRTIKHLKFGEVSIPGTVGRVGYNLVLLTRECVNDPHIVRLLGRWRKKHEFWFPSQFPVSFGRTRVWLQQRVIDEPDRLLCMIRVHDTYIGHVGLYRFDFKTGTCEIDNIVRGRREYPGIIASAISLMMSWGTRELGLKGYTLETTSDNEKALKLYKSLGFEESKRVKTENRYTVFMKRKGEYETK